MAPSEPSQPDTPGPHRGDQEPDPTGVRALLAGLPEPGPMPADLIHRIEVRLEAERAHQAATGSGGPSSADAPVDLSGERGRRRPTRTLALLGAAAVGLTVTTITLTQVLGDDPGGDFSTTAAQYPSREAAGSSGEAADSSVEGGADTEERAALSSPVQVTVLPELGQVQETTYGEQILAQSRQGDALSSTALSPFQAKTCWDNMPSDQWDNRYAAPATYDAQDTDTQAVVVLLGVDESGTAHAWMLPESCSGAQDVEPIDPAGSPIEGP